MRAIASYADTGVCCTHADVREVIRVYPAPARDRGDGGRRLTFASRPGPDQGDPRPGGPLHVDWQTYPEEGDRAISAASSRPELDDVRVRYLGRKSPLAQA